MYQRKVNVLLLVCSLIGGLAGFAVGEVILAEWEGRIPNALLMGAYFGQLALWIGLMCLIAELVSPKLNGKGWRLRYAKDGWKLLVPATLVLLLVSGALLQLVYGLHLGGFKPAQNIVVAIDVSESMKETDPNRESFRAAKELVQTMKPSKRVGVLTFSDQAELLQPLTSVSSQAAKDTVIGKLDSYGPPIGGTNIEAALAMAMEQIEADQTDKRRSMVILISDGYSDVDLNRALHPYTSNQIIVNTVGVKSQDVQGNELLRNIALRTGGEYHSVDDVQKLTNVFEQIYRANQSWHLVGERTGPAAGSLLYALERIVIVAVIGLLIGLSLGIIFDNRFLARSFSAGGALAGLLAGLILEQGLQSGDFPFWAVRAAADLTLAAVLSLATLLIPFKESRGAEESGNGPFSRFRKNTATTFGQQQGNVNKRFR
ncbi:vWA domain-containing protein [Paenibacillus oceani]|uniref:VWA domain-containing protein n=1 Tax=Paenibacillus oceani TaxID=2772510 RepID=A0A927H4E9_9BACL|nr:vWA domain-containing protein [Paenibacillus oceani]MBD2866449.1 VWA domain-containing protein [Paenibacillus oceani]